MATGGRARTATARSLSLILAEGRPGPGRPFFLSPAHVRGLTGNLLTRPPVAEVLCLPAPRSQLFDEPGIHPEVVAPGVE
jgi:hypothetical protein